MKPDVVDKLGELLKLIIANDFHIANIRMAKFTKEEATEFYQDTETANIA